MIDTLLSYIAPHPCCGCGKLSALLCDNCKYNINSEVFNLCIVCAGVATRGNLCSSCPATYARAWCVGERSDELRSLIDNYKFERMRTAHLVLAELLHERVDELPIGTVVVPIPGTPPHMRERGYDHMHLIARAFARKRHLALKQPLRRVTTTRQRGASRVARLAQAEAAYVARSPLNPTVPYLLIDDIVTTGATLESAAKALQAAGARILWVAVVARQPLD